MYPNVKLIATSQGLWDFRSGISSCSNWPMADFVTPNCFSAGSSLPAFIKYGKHAILPMACFYCTIYFGKPWENASAPISEGSFLVSWCSIHDPSLGLMVHLGIAWLMELGGYLETIGCGRINEKKKCYKPVSRILSWAIIYLSCHYFAGSICLPVPHPGCPGF